MPDTLLSTKLYIPRSRRELVPRPRLLERLDSGVSGKLTLVSAPAGYGKTTLVSEWIYSAGAGSSRPGVIPPAGRGTITAPLRVAWLSLDASDNDPARFFSYLIAALQQNDPGIGTEIQPILETESDLPIERLLAALVNDIAAVCSAGSPPASSCQCVLVLDDYHVIHEWEIHKALDFLVDHLPPGMHIVLISRANPPMPLGRLRVQGQLTEIREADLRFAPDEIAAFLNDRMGLELSNAAIASLEARTEGWIAGLQLAALTLQDRVDRDELIAAFTGSHRHLVEYLAHEVMARQPQEVQTFLLCTSILERFSASLCDAILGQGPTTMDAQPSGSSAVPRPEPLSSVVSPSSPSAEILDHLERANLFVVPLDDERQWYRFHHLFGDFLRWRLRRTSLALVPELYVRASQWYEAQGMVDEAIEHALAGDDVTRAAQLLDEHVEAYVFNAEIIRVRRWAGRLPVEERAKFPRLCIYYAWALQFEYQLEAAESALAQAEAHLDPTAQPPASFPASQIIAHANAIRVYLALHRGELARAVEGARATLNAPPENEADELHTVRGVTLLGLGMGYRQLGRMEAAYQALQSALPLNQQASNRYAALSCIYYMMWTDVVRGALGQAIANGEKGFNWIEQWSGSGRLNRPPARLVAHLRRQMGIVHYERNDLAQAGQYYRQASEYYELVSSWYRVMSYARLIDLHHALGDLAAARGYLRELVRIHLAPGFSLPDTPLAAMIAERSLLLGRSRPDLNDLLAEAVRWAESSGLEPDDEVPYEREYEYLILARVRIAQGRAQEVLSLLERLIASAEGAGRNGQLIAYLSLQAIAHHSCGRMDTALTALSRALVLGEPEGYVRTFVDEGVSMVELLLASRQRPAVSRAYVDRLLAALGDLTPEPHRRQSAEASGPSSALRPSSSPIEPLNDREMQMLRLIAAGLSDRQIARELYLSINTVKWYNRQIYSKLDVGRRGQAVARARELGIL